MTHVTLRFTGEIWSRTKTFQTTFQFQGTTLSDLLCVLFICYNLRDLVLDSDDQFIFRSGVLVNGRSAKYLGGLATPIHGGDEVIVMRPSIGAM